MFEEEFQRDKAGRLIGLRHRSDPLDGAGGGMNAIEAAIAYGGNMEADAAKWIKENSTKPVVGFIAGQTAPKGRRMGHAGAIIGGKDDTAAAKMQIMKECGIHVVESPADIGKTMAEALKK